MPILESGALLAAPEPPPVYRDLISLPRGRPPGPAPNRPPGTRPSSAATDISTATGTSTSATGTGAADPDATVPLIIPGPAPESERRHLVALVRERPAPPAVRPAATRPPTTSPTGATTTSRSGPPHPTGSRAGGGPPGAGQPTTASTTPAVNDEAGNGPLAIGHRPETGPPHADHRPFVAVAAALLALAALCGGALIGIAAALS